MDRATPFIVLLILLMVAVLPGCLDEDEPDGSELPHEGTTKHFRMPDFNVTTHDGSTLGLWSIDADYVIIHVVDPAADPFMPQFAQIRSVLGHWDNITVEALTTRDSQVYNGMTVGDLREEADADWPFSTPKGVIKDILSIQEYPSIFVLDTDQVILERSDEALGQGRIVQVIEATWGIEAPEDAHPEVGSAVPDLVWRDVDGVEGRLSDLRGSPVIINIWEMECPFCLLLFEDLEKVYSNYSGEGLQMVSLDLITWETDDEVRSVRESHNATWTFAVDGDNVQSRYDVWQLPLVVLLDGDGVVQWTWTGYVHHSIIAESVEKLI